jgi:translation elongation factor EF-Tu-like GTPase
MGAEKLTSTITGVEMFPRFLTEEKLEITLAFLRGIQKKTLKRNGYL